MTFGFYRSGSAILLLAEQLSFPLRTLWPERLRGVRVSDVKYTLSYPDLQGEFMLHVHSSIKGANNA
jgi:hypothetical protein